MTDCPSGSGAAKRPPTILDIINAKNVRKLVMLTAYDAPGARIAEAGGADLILVGDSAAMTVLGRPDTNSISMDEMLHHARAVTAAARSALVVGDMPFLSYESGPDDALRNAGRFFREAGIRALKLEGGRQIVPQIKALVDAGIPVMGHLGLTPQRAAMLGGFKAQARTAEGAQKLLEDALALEDAGCWPVAGGKAVMAYPFTEESAGEWYWEEEPWKLVSDPVLVQAARSWGPLLVQRGGEEVRLAASFRGGGQFPLVPLFCFGTVGQIRGREYVIFLFDRQGTPKMPYNLEKGGKPKAVDQSR